MGFKSVQKPYIGKQNRKCNFQYKCQLCRILTVMSRGSGDVIFPQLPLESLGSGRRDLKNGDVTSC